MSSAKNVLREIGIRPILKPNRVTQILHKTDLIITSALHIPACKFNGATKSFLRIKMHNLFKKSYPNF